MDELELLKKDWQKQENTLPELSYDQLYNMHLKKSSSIVKWILIISILEFIAWIALDIGMRITGQYSDFSGTGIPYFSAITTVIAHGVLVYFVIRFYISYKRIQVTDSSKILMKNILNTRKAVKQYVWTNVSFFTILCTIMIVFTLGNNPELGELDTNMKILFLVLAFGLMIVFIGLIFLFYRIVYGILTRKLQQNYDELRRVEV